METQVYMSKLTKPYTLILCSFLYTNFNSIKLGAPGWGATIWGLWKVKQKECKRKSRSKEWPKQWWWISLDFFLPLPPCFDTGQIKLENHKVLTERKKTPWKRIIFLTKGLGKRDFTSWRLWEESLLFVVSFTLSWLCLQHSPS